MRLATSTDYQSCANAPKPTSTGAPDAPPEKPKNTCPTGTTCPNGYECTALTQDICITKYCDATNKCANKPGVDGSSCTTDTECSGLANGKCVESTCKVVIEGISCTTDTECSGLANGKCVESKCTTGSGGPPQITNNPSSNTGGTKSKCDWSCDYWSACSNDLKQKRTCYPSSGCYSKPKEETRTCAVCTPSWFCGSWSDSINDCGTRNCVDERSCGTSTGKPVTSQSCPIKNVIQKPAPVTGATSNYVPTKTIKKDVAEPSLWSQYKLHIIGGVLGVAVLGIIIILLVVFMGKKGSDVTELVSWIEGMKSRKASESQMRSILRNQGSWSSDDVNHAFKKVK
jgi:hypothetical protein